MTNRAPDSQLGGRLTLLSPDELDEAATIIHQRIIALVGPEAAAAGYRAHLEDGRLLGPFNALLHAPALTDGLARWTSQIGAAGIDQRVRETIILTVGQHWGAPFEIYAHTAGARTAGLSERTITALLEREPVRGTSRDIALAQELTLVLLEERTVPDDLYTDLDRQFGVETIIACLHLVAQYQFISSILVTFEIPAPCDESSDS